MRGQMNMGRYLVYVLAFAMSVCVASCCERPYDCEIYGCPCAYCPPPEGYGEVMCPGDGVAYMIADSRCETVPPECTPGLVTWTCADGTAVTPLCCEWPTW